MTQPRWETLAPTFPKERHERAVEWAGHVARLSQLRCRVESRRDGRWVVLRERPRGGVS